MFRLALVTDSTTPIYRQIVDQVERAIASGALALGEELPSVRSIADTHAINPMTVSKAYALLAERGAIERRKGVGMYVLGERESAREREKKLISNIYETVLIAKGLGVSKDRAVALFAAAFDQTSKGSKDE